MHNALPQFKCSIRSRWISNTDCSINKRPQVNRDSIVTTHWRVDCQSQKWKHSFVISLCCLSICEDTQLCHKTQLSGSQFNFENENTMSFYLWESKTQSSPDYTKEFIIQKLSGFQLFGDLTDTYMLPATLAQKGCILGNVCQAL